MMQAEKGRLLAFFNGRKKVRISRVVKIPNDRCNSRNWDKYDAAISADGNGCI
jgi:hypothetical protein